MAAVTHAVAGIHLEEEKKAPAKKKKKAAGGAAAATSSGGPASSLQEVFTKFANGPEMDGKTFVKMAKDCKVINKKCTNTDIDLIFARNKGRAERKINVSQFCAALAECAAKRGEDMATLEAMILSQGGPVFAGTQAEAVRFHDDKDAYTGVHAHGGPSTVGGTGGISDISQLCDRGAADVRGVQR